MNIILWALLISVGLNLILFVPAYLYKTDRLTDLSYSVTFLIVSGLAFAKSGKQPVQQIVLAMVVLWALRLGGFLFIRISKNKKDSRFDEMRQKPLSFLRFWFFQGLTVFIVLAAALGLWNDALTKVSVLVYAGWLVFGLGLAIEAVADYQKYRFNSSKTKDVWIDTGFWRISRHPNYLGEIMVWAGVYIVCFSSLSTLGRILGLASPLYIAGILLFFSGIPLLEKSAEKKWGSDKAYEEYKQQVPLLIPTIKSLKRL